MSHEIDANHITTVLSEMGAGNLDGFLNLMEPDVRWQIGSQVKDPLSLTGLYNRESWLEEVYRPLKSKLRSGGIEMKILGVDVVGNKCYAELQGRAWQINGKPYDNDYCFVFVFNERGKASEIREYINSALLKEVVTEN